MQIDIISSYTSYTTTITTKLDTVIDVSDAVAIGIWGESRYTLSTSISLDIKPQTVWRKNSAGPLDIDVIAGYTLSTYPSGLYSQAIGDIQYTCPIQISGVTRNTSNTSAILGIEL